MNYNSMMNNILKEYIPFNLEDLTSQWEDLVSQWDAFACKFFGWDSCYLAPGRDYIQKYDKKYDIKEGLSKKIIDFFDVIYIPRGVKLISKNLKNLEEAFA